MTRRYLPTTLPDLARDWTGDGPAVRGVVEAHDDTEESEYAALMDAADASAAMVAGLPDGERRRVVVVVEAGAPEVPSWRHVVAVHVDSGDDADPDDDLGWWATQEIGDLVAGG
ncbi:MAG: hypothetical protein LT071_08950 [Nocardioides sp.]|nr:hypothetical protein [Nocardioides sp.]